MYGFGDAAPELNFLVGCEVLQVCLGEFETQLLFAGARLSMEAAMFTKFELKTGGMSSPARRPVQMNSIGWQGNQYRT